MSMDKPFIYLRGIRKEYSAEDGSSVKVLDGLDFEAEPGQFVAIRGESGSGKTTLLRILGLVDPNYTGEFFLGGRPIRRHGIAMPRIDQEELRADSIGFIFQEDRLLEHLNVRDNIELPLRIRGMRTRQQLARLRESIESIYRAKEIGEGKILDRNRSKLSGGQRQRASVLRALAHSPLLLLADEPTASLDRELKAEIFDTLSLLARAGKTVVVVSHDEIFERADLVYELRDGKLILSGGSSSAVRSGGIDSTPHPPKREFPVASGLLGRMRRLGRNLLPRTPLTLQISLAARDLFRSWLFTLLALGALTTGAFQLTLLWSLESGTRELLDDLIRKGSRLNRITVPVKPQNLTAAQRFPDRPRIGEIAGVTQVVPRREGIYRVQDRMGRDRFETIFGLETQDPELEKLTFSAGSGFSAEEALEVIMSERSIQRLFEVPGEIVSDRFRKELIGQKIWFSVARPPAGTTLETMSDDVSLEVLPFRLTLVGIVAQAEADRNFYFPRTTQLLFERWRLDEERAFTLPLNDEHDHWTAPP